MRRAEGFDLQQPDTPFPGIALDGLEHRAPDPATVMSTFNHHQVPLRDVREMASHEGHPDNHSPGVTHRPLGGQSTTPGSGLLRAVQFVGSHEAAHSVGSSA